ncbi:MAG: hypothetical protein ACI837_001515 [Crocinitomicaceae bacterium]|jgi:hypothetical protein
MKTEHVRFKDVAKRSQPSFVIRYKLVDTIKTRPFQGYLISFAYNEPVDYSDFFCDVFPEFKTKLEGGQMMKRNEFIPEEGYADMWIISNENMDSHKGLLKLGAKCFFLNNHKLIAECEIVKINMHFNKSDKVNKEVHDTKVMIHNIAQSVA